MRDKIFIVLTILITTAIICSIVIDSYMLGFILSVILAIIIVIEIILTTRPSSDEDKYYSFLKKIKKAFLTILVASTEIPDLGDKIIVKVDNIDDLVDISENVRKPIYYIEGIDNCDFILIHDDQACVYTLKAHEDSISKMDNYLKEIEEKKKENHSMNLKNLEKTMIIEIPDGGLYRVSPIKGKASRDRQKQSMMQNLELPKLK